MLTFSQTTINENLNNHNDSQNYNINHNDAEGESCSSSSSSDHNSCEDCSSSNDYSRCCGCTSDQNQSISPHLLSAEGMGITKRSSQVKINELTAENVFISTGDGFVQFDPEAFDDKEHFLSRILDAVMGHTVQPDHE